MQGGMITPCKPDSHQQGDTKKREHLKNPTNIEEILGKKNY
jgi:hypothetical protein